ncbi:MAG TPA: hypothetical protein ENN45_00240 [Bacteroidetes bacterium]|nr:hypothetical protein [Bacteroidota bacterium]
MRKQVIKLGKNTIIYGVGNTLTRFIHLLLLPIFTAYLSPAEYGVLAILALLNFIAIPVFSLGLSAGMGPCYFEGDNETRKATTIWTAFLLILLSTLLLVALGYFFADWISLLAFQSIDHSWLVTLSLWGVSFQILSIPFSRRLQFEEKATLFIKITITSTLISIGLSVYMVVILKLGVYGMVVSQLIGHAIYMLLFMTTASYRMKFRFERTVCSELLKLGLPLVPSFAFLFILQHSNRYILQWFKGLDEVGIYSIGFNFGMVMGVVVGAFQTAWYPFFMSFMERQREAIHLFGRITTLYIFGAGAFCLLFFIAAKPIVVIMTQPSFHEAYLLVGLSASAQFLVGLFSLLLPAVYFSKDIKYVSIVQGVAACCSIGINLILIPPLGMLGAGIALALGYLLMVILLQVWNLMKTHAYLQITYEWVRVLKFVPVFIVIATMSLIDRELSLWTEFIFSIVLTVMLIVVMYTMLNTNEKNALLAYITRVNENS